MKTYSLDGVILRDFSPEEPALSEVEGMLLPFATFAAEGHIRSMRYASQAQDDAFSEQHNLISLPGRRLRLTLEVEWKYRSAHDYCRNRKSQLIICPRRQRTAEIT
jgi:hypothetical protein